jgi:hypothetical protein
MIFGYIVGAIVLAAVAWVFGSIIARVGGIVICLFGLFTMAAGGAGSHNTSAGVAGLVAFAFGVALWLAGHGIYAYKHHVWRGGLVGRLFQTTSLRRFDLTRGWGYPVTPADRDR